MTPASQPGDTHVAVAVAVAGIGVACHNLCSAPLATLKPFLLYNFAAAHCGAWWGRERSRAAAREPLMYRCCASPVQILHQDHQHCHPNSSPCFPAEFRSHWPGWRAAAGRSRPPTTHRQSTLSLVTAGTHSTCVVQFRSRHAVNTVACPQETSSKSLVTGWS